MLHSFKQLYGHKLGASDGEIGHVKDFYFDDQSWAVRYVVADTGSWLTGRKVLLSPHAFGNLDKAGNVLLVNLTRKQIEDSPPIELHRPVSRQFEREYYRHYGWPCYWQGEALWGMSSLPILESPASAPQSSAASGTETEPADPHLLSAQAVSGYQLQASDGLIGHVCDFMMDGESWAISHFVIMTGHRFSGTEVCIPTSNVIRISYSDSTVFVNMTKETILPTSSPHLASAGIFSGVS